MLQLVESGKLSMRTECDVNALWPPKIWISRPDWGMQQLEQTIVVPCTGTKELPQIDAAMPIKGCDSVFVDFGRRRVSIRPSTAASMATK